MKFAEYNMNTIQERFRPRLIVWEMLAKKEAKGGVAPTASGNGHRDTEPLSTHECLLIIDSIARTAKPIIVLSGRDLFERSDLFVIVEYGVALGLKMIIEARPVALTEEILRTFSVFGNKIFRLLLDDCIAEDPVTRYEKSSGFLALEKAVERLRQADYEIHLGLTITTTDIRELAFKHDYAFRRSADGLYCHLCFEDGEEDPKSLEAEEHGIGKVIDAIARMKGISPKNMFFSPQCIKYELRHSDEIQGLAPKVEDDADFSSSHWTHCCFGGKTYAFIAPTGIVQVCASQSQECGDLRANGYNFESIWEKSDVFQQLRQQILTCPEARAVLKPEELTDHREK
jgi:MoaA/NifB/PqqE/SkfB family radical SAM enzyme